ncbi:MAG: hypothetical protein HY755_09405, partial [Nitrospirae bacterium]|nr:hypothetical protein [Nitrospirota bacterium]
ESEKNLDKPTKEKWEKERYFISTGIITKKHSADYYSVMPKIIVGQPARGRGR